MPRFKLLAGTHEDVKGKRFEAAENNIIEDEHPLHLVFPNKFRLLAGTKSEKEDDEAPKALDATQVAAEAQQGLDDEVEGELRDGGMRRELTTENVEKVMKKAGKKMGFKEK